MRKYYLFLITRTAYQAYQSKEMILFQSLKKLKDTKNHIEGLSLYFQICDPFLPELLVNYFSKKYVTKPKRHYYFHDSNKSQSYYLELNYSCLILLSNDYLPFLFRNISYYSPYIFVCDFENEDYFWLRDITSRSKKHEYNRA